MILQILSMAWYSIAFAVSIGWVLSMIVPDDTNDHVRLVLGVSLVAGSIFIGYLLAFDKAIDTDCRPSGPAIYNDC